MNSVLSNNAAKLAPSLNGEESWDYAASVRRAANSLKSNSSQTLLEKYKLNRSKLVTACVVEYRSNFAAVYEKKQTLPREIFEKIGLHVDEFIAAALNVVNASNVTDVSRKYKYSKFVGVTEVVVLTGVNIIDLRRQINGVQAFLYEENRKLDRLNRSNHDGSLKERTEKTEKRIREMEITKNLLQMELDKIEELKAEAAAK